MSVTSLRDIWTSSHISVVHIMLLHAPSILPNLVKPIPDLQAPPVMEKKNKKKPLQSLSS